MFNDFFTILSVHVQRALLFFSSLMIFFTTLRSFKETIRNVTTLSRRRGLREMRERRRSERRDARLTRCHIYRRSIESVYPQNRHYCILEHRKGVIDGLETVL